MCDFGWTILQNAIDGDKYEACIKLSEVYGVQGDIYDIDCETECSAYNEYLAFMK